MTSISQKPGLQPQQGQSQTTPAASQAHSPSPSVSGPKTYANATKKPASSSDSTSAPLTVGGSAPAAQHGKSSSVSPVNGKPMQQSSGLTIVNGGPQGDHGRKPSVTITSAGASGYIPNGGSAGSRPSSIQFGSMNQQTSPNMGGPAVLANQSNLGLSQSMNPRITSPQTSPSPIPQPASSGGRPPPSTYQSQGNGPSFGSFGESGDANVSFSDCGNKISHYFERSWKYFFSSCVADHDV